MVAPNFYNQADQNIYNQGYSFIPQERFRGGAFNMPSSGGGNTGGVTTLPVNPFMNSGGGGGAAFTGTTRDLTTNFMDTTTNRQNRLFNAYDNPDMAKIGGFFPAFKQDVNPVDAGEYLAAGQRIPQQRTMLGKMFQPQSAQEIIEQGYTPGVKLGILSNLMPDRYGTLPRGDQAFIARNMGYTGPTVFGENTSGLSKDPFGLNTRSGFGNYAERVGIEASKLGEALTGRLSDKYDAEFDEETGMFIGKNAALANQMTKMMRAKYGFYTQQTKQRDADRKAAEEARMKESAANRAAANKITERLDREFRDSSGGGFDVSGPDTSSNPTGRSNRASQERGFSLHGADGGRVAYMMGGLADLVDIYD